MLLQTNATPEFFLFLGRFHPLVVHLPIGILLLAALMEIASRSKRYAALSSAIPFVLLLGTASAFLAAILGYFLSWGGDYDASTLFWHQWLGIGLAVVALLAYLWKIGKLPALKLLSPQRLQLVLASLILLLMTFTGHLGGSLTHGSNYLTYYMPQPLRSLAGLPPRKEPRPPITNLDSAEVFADIILPMLEDRCQSCHNPSKKKGGLLLTSQEDILAGGKHGDVVVASKPEASELYKRITLPEDHDDFMPPEGKKPLTKNQVAAMEWWIAQGAPFDGRVAEMKMDEDARQLFAKVVGLEVDETAEPDGPTGLLAEAIAPLDQGVMDNIRSQGFKVYEIAQEVHYLDVDFSLADTTLGASQLNSLLKAKEHIVWLNLSGSDITDEGLKTIGQLEHLIRLRLDQTAITEAGLQHLTGLQHLEYLNVYGTQVGDGLIEPIKAMPKLKKLFLWQTNVSPEAVQQLQQALPELEINTGVNFADAGGASAGG